jgi:WD40 repeat protein
MHVSSAAYSSEGSQVIAGCSDGSIHLFHEKNRYGKGLQIVRSAHIGNEITGLKYLFNDTQLVSRGTDDCVNFWDLRKFKDPIRSWTDIPTVRSLSNISISPDQSSWLVMGSALGELLAIDLTQGEVCWYRRKLQTPQLIRTDWNGSLNQIFSTSNDGNIFLCYSESESRNGALSFIHKKPSKSLVTIEPSVSAANVFAYEDLIESGDYRENKLGDLRQVTEKLRVPKPIEIGSTDVVWSALEKRKRGIETGEILPQADEETTKLVSEAYKKTQPEKLLDFSESTGQVDKLLQQKTYCPRCGLKICTCGFMAGSGAGKFITQPIQGPQVTTGHKKFKP